MKRIFLLAAISMAFVKSSEAQRFVHGAGVGIFIEDTKMMNVKGTYSLTYSPRLSFAETDNTSFSIGIPLNVGVSVSYDAYYSDYYYDNTRVGYMINVPLIFNFNIGAGSARGCQDRMGFFFGGGYAYHVGNIDEYKIDPTYGFQYMEENTRSSTGPVANIGLRIGVGAKKKHNIEIRTSYMRGLTSYKPHVFGVNCLFNF